MTADNLSLIITGAVFSLVAILAMWTLWATRDRPTVAQQVVTESVIPDRELADALDVLVADRCRTARAEVDRLIALVRAGEQGAAVDGLLDLRSELARVGQR
jgi:hypothetical protein